MGDDSRQCLKMRPLIAHISHCRSLSIPSIRCRSLSRISRTSAVTIVQWLPAVATLGLKHRRGPLPESLTLVSRRNPNTAEVDPIQALLSAMAVHLLPWPRLPRMAWCQAPHHRRAITAHAALILIASLTVHVWRGLIAWLKHHLCCRNSSSIPCITCSSNRCPGPCILLVERSGLNLVEGQGALLDDSRKSACICNSMPIRSVGQAASICCRDPLQIKVLTLRPVWRSLSRGLSAARQVAIAPPTQIIAASSVQGVVA